MSHKSTPLDSSSVFQRGLSLVELMVALAIGLLLLLGLVEIFGASRAAFSSAEGSARIQENSRFALEFLRRDVRMAGHMGCQSELGYQALGSLTNHNSATPGLLSSANWAMRIDMPVEAYDYENTGPGLTYDLDANGIVASEGANEWAPDLPAELSVISTEAIKGSDVLVLRFLSAESVRLDEGSDASSGVVDVQISDPSWIAFNPFVEAGRIYAITDCLNLSLFQANNGADVNGRFNALAGGANVTALSGSYGGREVLGQPPSRLFRYEIAVYYVALDAGGQPALFVRNFLNDPTVGFLGPRRALVDGVENLQLTFGSDSRNAVAAGGRDDYVDLYGSAADISAAAMNATAWQRVISMRVGLLVRSPSPSAAVEGAVPIPLRVADTVITPPDDLRLRSTYESMVAVRNRVRN